MDDARALDEMAAMMDGREWGADTASDIADILRATGRIVRDVTEDEEAPLTIREVEDLDANMVDDTEDD